MALWWAKLNSEQVSKLNYTNWHLLSAALWNALPQSVKATNHISNLNFL